MVGIRSPSINKTNMTDKEFKKIKLMMISHMSMEHKHVSTYVNPDYGLTVRCITPYKDGIQSDKQKVEYMLNGKRVSRKKLLTMI